MMDLLPPPRPRTTDFKARFDEDNNYVPIPITTNFNAEKKRQYLTKELEKTTFEYNQITTSDEMTFWSRYDPVSQPRGNTDHWTKMKQRAVQFRSLDNPASLGKPITLDSKLTSMDLERVERVGQRDMSFDDYVTDTLQGNMPGHYMYTRPRNSVSRDRLRSAYNERAREGFRYWLIERPKPTSFGKYGIGSYKTVLGVGNAPRT